MKALTVPVRTVDFTYYDGTDWVDEWDSQTMGRLPWCVRVRINFARTDEEILAEKDQNLDIVENPDFEIVVPIPLALGQQTDGRSQAQLDDAAADQTDPAASDGATAGGTGNTPTNGSGPTTSAPKPTRPANSPRSPFGPGSGPRPSAGPRSGPLGGPKPR